LRLAAFFVSALIAAVGLVSTSGRCESIASPRAERDTPAFRLTDTSGTQIALSSLAGRTVVVHFFATWCEPCREELPALDRLAARGRDVAVVAIAVAEVPIRVKRFLAQAPVAFPVLLDEDRAVAKGWNVTTLPTSFVLDADLKVRRMIAHTVDWDRFDFTELTATNPGEGR
jgi:thiol-disulfide isomerase/thioredoxin